MAQDRIPSLPGERAAAGLSADVVNVLRNTYMLLGMTLAFSALTAYLATAMGIGRPGFFLTLGIFFGLLFLVEKTADSAWGLVSVFLFTGFLGVVIAPLVAAVAGMQNGGMLVTGAFATASAAFVSLSAVALTTRRDFSFLGKFILVGVVVGLVSMVVAYLFSLPALWMAVSAAFAIIACALILWQTSAIVNGGERNYIRATTTLFVSFYNLFSFLLQMFGIMGDE